MTQAFEDFKSAFAAAGTDTAKQTAVDDLTNAWNTHKDKFDAGTTTDFQNALDGYTAAGDKAVAYQAIVDGQATLAAKTTAPTPGTGKPAALDAVKQIDKALESIATSRADLGATLNRLDFNVTNLKSQENSMAASASQIEDADMAKEMSEMTKFKILNEAGISMLSQANQTPQMVSKLLQ